MSGRGPAPEASGASCSAQPPPADPLDAVAEDTRRRSSQARSGAAGLATSAAWTAAGFAEPRTGWTGSEVARPTR